MAEYMSPSQFITPNQWKADGALGGFLAGANQSVADQMVDRGFRDSDLGFLGTLNRYQNDLKENPAKEAEYGARERSANQASKIMDTGLPMEEALSKIRTGISENDTKQSNNAITKQQNVAEAMYNASQVLQMKPYDPMDQSSVDTWKEIRKNVSEAGGPSLPLTPSNDDLYKIHTVGQTLMNSPKFVQARQLQAAKHQEDLEKTRLLVQGGLDKAYVNADARIYGADAATDRAVQTAQIRAQMQTDRIRDAKKAEEDALKVKNDPNATSEQVVDAAATLVDQELQKNDSYKMLRIMKKDTEADVIRESAMVQKIKSFSAADKVLGPSPGQSAVKKATTPVSSSSDAKVNLFMKNNPSIKSKEEATKILKENGIL